MKPSAPLQIIRPVNSLVAGLAGILAYIIATGTLLPAVLIVFGMILLITAAGNVINDYYDAAIDAINRPDRPIPSGAISGREALALAVLLFLAGNILGIISAPLPLVLIAIINSFLLWIYAAYLKGMPLLGNLAVSCLAASIFLFGGALDGWAGLMANLPVAGATFCVMIARELIKDAEDIPGDMAQGARTFPIIFGLKKSLLLAMGASVAGVLITLLLADRWGSLYLAGIIPVDLLILAGAFRAVKARTVEEVRRSRGATIIKAGMFASLVVFLAASLLFR